MKLPAQGWIPVTGKFQNVYTIRVREIYTLLDNFHTDEVAMLFSRRLPRLLWTLLMGNEENENNSKTEIWNFMRGVTRKERFENMMAT